MIRGWRLAFEILKGSTWSAPDCSRQGQRWETQRPGTSLQSGYQVAESQSVLGHWVPRARRAWPLLPKLMGSTPILLAGNLWSSVYSFSFFPRLSNVDSTPGFLFGLFGFALAPQLRSFPKRQGTRLPLLPPGLSPEGFASREKQSLPDSTEHGNDGEQGAWQNDWYSLIPTCSARCGLFASAQFT